LSNVDGFIKTGVAQKRPLADICASLCGAVDKTAFYTSVLRLIEAGEIPNVLVCCCGHDCSRCLTFRATLADDAAMREKSARFYRTAMGMEIPPEKLRCLGGRSGEPMEACRGCPFLNCCKEKGLHACEECAHYPCKTLGWYMEKYVNKANQVQL